jgi:hypothetical protein
VFFRVRVLLRAPVLFRLPVLLRVPVLFRLAVLFRLPVLFRPPVFFRLPVLFRVRELFLALPPRPLEPFRRLAAAARPPLRELLRLVALPRPEPLFFPPPVSWFTVAQARRSASRRETPRSS